MSGSLLSFIGSLRRVQESARESQVQNRTPFRHMADKMIDLNDLRIFAYVASLGSFSSAADALQIHKSSVSRSIARLEAMLEEPLLQRTTRKVLLTQRGIDLKERCVEMLARVNETIGYVGSIDDTAPQSLPVRSGSGALSGPKGMGAAERKPLLSMGRIQVRLGASHGSRQQVVGRFGATT